jgi:hypothetical protein
LLNRAKLRARAGGYPCTITIDDINIPDICPALGIRLEIGKGKIVPASPTLDKIIPERGYVPQNVQVISWKANTMKSNASRGELIAFARWILSTPDGQVTAR